eukprot:5205456-Prymnesium_polylepis.2
MPAFSASVRRARRYFQSLVSLSSCTATIGPPSLQKRPFSWAATAVYQADVQPRYDGSVERTRPHDLSTQSGWPPLRTSP